VGEKHMVEQPWVKSIWVRNIMGERRWVKSLWVKSGEKSEL